MAVRKHRQQVKTNELFTSEFRIVGLFALTAQAQQAGLPV